MIVGKEMGYETYLFKIRELLKGASFDLHEMLKTSSEFFSVDVLGECGTSSVYFTDFITARNYYLLLDRSYKVLYEHKPNGERKRMEKHDMIRKPFDYAEPVKDIRRVPCMKLRVYDTEAYAHFPDAVYCYKFNDKRKVWNLVEITK